LKDFRAFFVDSNNINYFCFQMILRDVSNVLKHRCVFYDNVNTLKIGKNINVLNSIFELKK
jgi:hypothetical protein